MQGLRNPSVVIARCREYDNFDNVFDAVIQVLDAIGGLESIVSAGDRVLIKPNLVTSKPYTTGATTNPHIVKALARLCRQAGASEVVIGEGSAVGNSATEAFEVCGMNEIAKEERCRVVDFAKDTYSWVVNPAAKIFKRIRVPKTFLESNVIINVPVMKTHDALNVTLGLKNMKGIIHVTDKKRFHKWGLAQSVVDLNQIALPELTVMDGTVAMEGEGPGEGDPVGLGLILASTDTVACDRVAAEIMGFKVDEIDYIRMAGEQGLGCFELSNIEVLGEKIADVAKPFKRTALDPEQLKKLGINLISCDACSGCSMAVKNYLVRLERKGTMESLRGCTIVYGQNAAIPQGAEGRIIRLGTCTRKLDCCSGVYITGCPPHPHDIDEKLKEIE